MRSSSGYRVAHTIAFVLADSSPAQQSALLKRVQEMLGVPRLKSDQGPVRLIEDRLATTILESLRRSGLTDEEIYALILPRRTLTHRRARRRR